MSTPAEETPAAKPRRGCRFVFKLLLFAFVLVLLACALAALGGFMVYQHVTQPGVAGELIAVDVPSGANGKQVGELLAQKGLIEHEAFFRLAVKLDKTGKPLRHGAYTLPKGFSAMQLLKILQGGPNRTLAPDQIPEDRKVIVPEGMPLSQMARLFTRPEAFLEAARDPALIAKLGLKVPSLEGFLFPNTYFFDEKPTEHAVAERMAEQFVKAYDELKKQVPGAATQDLLQVVTVASLIESEAKLPEERPKVAAVIYNRLKKNMPLQIDATVQYALDKKGERVLYADLDVDSPYNTYKHAGLPPGPICSPGLSALRAALQTSSDDYLYYVSNADGKTHTFSSNEKDHLKAVARFRREIKAKRHDEKAKP